MTPMDHVPILQGHCYVLDPSGHIMFETKETSKHFFVYSGLIHTVVPQGERPKEFLSAWSKEVSDNTADRPHCFYQLRLVGWMQQAWFILSLSHHAIYSLAVMAEQYDYVLSVREFSVVKPDGYMELFPFYGPWFRTLRPSLVRLEVR
jgi:hypothetical protein